MYSFIVKLRQTHTQKKVNLTKTLFYKVWEWCNLTPSRKCASVHRSVLLCFTILFFSPFRWHRFRTLSPCRPLVCSCLWRGCQHVSLPTSLSLSLSIFSSPPQHWGGFQNLCDTTQALWAQTQTHPPTSRRQSDPLLTMLRGKQIEKWVSVEGGPKWVKNTWLIPSSAFIPFN